MTPERVAEIKARCEAYHWKCKGCPRKCTATSLDNANPWNCHYADKSDQTWEKVETQDLPDCIAEIERLHTELVNRENRIPVLFRRVTKLEQK